MGRTLTTEQVRAESIAAMGDQLGQLHYDLGNELSWLHIKWAQYRELFGADPAHIALLNETAPFFFGFIQTTLFEDVLLAITRLTDPPGTKGQTNLSLRSLVPLLKPGKLREELQHLLDKLDAKAAFARDWRNRRLAHRDLATYRDEHPRTLAPATRQAVESALSAIRAVLNVLENHFLDGPVAYELSIEGPGNAKALLYHLQRSVRAEQDELERWTGPK